MKKAIIVIIIFTLLAISLTYFLINIENEKNAEIISSNYSYNVQSNDIDNKSDEHNVK